VTGYETAWANAVELRIGLHVGESTAAGVAARWDSAEWDDPAALWGGGEGSNPDAPNAVWEWLDCDVQVASTNRGRAEWSQHYDTGSLVATLYNLAGHYTMENVHPGQLVPLDIGRVVRLEARHLGATDWVTVYTGQVMKLVEKMNAAGIATIDIQAADAFSYLGRIDFLAEHTTPPHEDADARVTRILDKANWPIDRRDIQPVAIEIHDNLIAGNALSELKLVAESSAAEVLVDANGRVAFYPGSQVFDPLILPTVGVLTAVRSGAGSDMTAVPPEVCITDPLTLTRDIKRVVNDVHLVSGHATGIAADGISQGLYGIRTWQRTNLLTASQGVLQAIADNLLARQKDTASRLDQATVLVTTAAEAEWVLARQFGDHVQLRYVHPVYGWPINADAQIIGITHTVTAAAWRTTFATDDIFDPTP